MTVRFAVLAVHLKSPERIGSDGATDCIHSCRNGEHSKDCIWAAWKTIRGHRRKIDATGDCGDRAHELRTPRARRGDGSRRRILRARYGVMASGTV
jgi:hypothetical protein